MTPAPGDDAAAPADEVELALDAVDDVVQPDEGGLRGLRAISGDTFSARDAVGGVRGVLESIAPGLLFVVVYLVAGQQLKPALIAASAAAVIAVVARLVQRQPMTQAFSGVLGVGIGVLWAWRSGQASDYFAFGLWTNLAYLVVTLVSILVGWPLVGVVVGALRVGSVRGEPAGKDGAAAGKDGEAVSVRDVFAEAFAWRKDPALRRRYAIATWPWVAMFALRLAVQVPLYRADQVGWLGTAKLVMGVPLTALVLWISWVLVRGSAASREPSRPRPAP
jgi:hypothetical protein